MLTIGLLSDTHATLPPRVLTHFQEVDEIWHAGDIGSIAVADQLEAFKPLRMVYGNIDGAELRIRYPEHLVFTLEKVKILMMHIGGYPPRYNPEAKKLLDLYRPDIFICGHSHILKVMPDAQRNLLHINPGACGHSGWHKKNTILRFHVDNDRLRDLEVIEWDRSARE